ncbi:MAG: nucleotide exchange factor GrpE [Fimbriimonadaceae bacterium]|nr:nucleotide exchange factor GrpE [Fimbriimonadaceae bacterium]
MADLPVDEEREVLENKLAQLNEVAEALKDENLRLRADMQNMRRRQQQELEKFRLYATEDLVVKLLPVLDNFERAIQSAEAGASVEALLDGVKAVDRQLRAALEGVRLSRIGTEGTPFDPEHHEALAAEVNDEVPADTVLHVLEPGYKIADKVVRPAKVRVSKRS